MSDSTDSSKLEDILDSMFQEHVTITHSEHEGQIKGMLDTLEVENEGKIKKFYTISGKQPDECRFMAKHVAAINKTRTKIIINGDHTT